jgi:hypothetical protein
VFITNGIVGRGEGSLSLFLRAETGIPRAWHPPVNEGLIRALGRRYLVRSLGGFKVACRPICPMRASGGQTQARPTLRAAPGCFASPTPSPLRVPSACLEINLTLGLYQGKSEGDKFSARQHSGGPAFSLAAMRLALRPRVGPYTLSHRAVPRPEMVTPYHPRPLWAWASLVARPFSVFQSVAQ